ncbi:glycosyl hydrolase [Cohnella cholangitidis]|uniref:GH26 domain-containing protein n=1 Tax=Cohnella cholangitidis TaxID=2598458 RepID=A0A7G5C1Z4_9BACL|nr:glycosyl hydrolase [Cohnella cholangitidis]QMV43228.1 hypothetical protein FPL14_20115 [Cohnella cholangitidis]
MAGRPPVNGNASGQAKQLLSYLNTLSSSPNTGMLTGQHNWLGDPTGNITNLVLPISGGKYPAISSFELGAIGGQSDAIVNSQRQETVDAAIAYRQAGGIPAFCWHQQFPLTANTWANVWNDTNKNGYKTQAEFNQCVTPGTAQYNWLLAEYDKVAVHLKVLRDAGIPVLFRPYHEMNGYWFWWGKKNNYKLLWELIYDRFVVYHGLNNLLFVWNTHCPRAVDPYIADFRLYYPGTVTGGARATGRLTSLPMIYTRTSFCRAITTIFGLSPEEDRSDCPK